LKLSAELAPIAENRRLDLKIFQAALTRQHRFSFKMFFVVMNHQQQMPFLEKLEKLNFVAGSDRFVQRLKLACTAERIVRLAVRHLLQRFSGSPGDRACAFRIMLMPRTTSVLDKSLLAIKARPFVAAAGLIAGALVASAIVNKRLAKKAQRENPPIGRFIEVNGVRIHYVERGAGRPLVLFHGNGSMIQDFESSGLIELAAENYRVIVFDRPGYGHSDRPRNVIWTPQAQADLFFEALERLGVRGALVLGHSWGASVAVSLALKHPQFVEALVLASGYYFPTARADLVAMSAPAIPGFGDILSYTVSPLVSRMIWPLLLKVIFGPGPVPRKFDAFPKAMAVRPSQLHASAEESALMIPNAIASSGEYGNLKMPVIIIAGGDDRLIDTEQQSGRLHDEVRQSKMYRVPGTGHMVHQTATSAVMSAIHEAAAA
jgi:pimeloyl-ACP methyl ester carboxylesterase